MVETKVLPQNIDLTKNTSMVPSFVGMPWYDVATKELKFVNSVDGLGNPLTHVPALPQHTLTGEHGPKVTITQTSVDNALVINQTQLAAAVSLTCGVSGGVGIDIAQLAPLPGIRISKPNIGGGSVIDVTNMGTGHAIAVSQQGSGACLAVAHLVPGTAVMVDQYSDSIGLLVTKHHAGTTNPAVFVSNAGSNAMVISQSANADALVIEKPTTGAGACIGVRNSGIGDSISVTSTTTPSSNKGLSINHRGAAGGFGAHIQQRGDAQALYIEKLGAGTADCVDIINTTGGCALNIATTSSGAGSPGIQLFQYGNAHGMAITQVGAGDGLHVEKTGTESSDVVHFVNNAGTGDVLEVWQYRAGVGIHVHKSNVGAGDAILVTNSGSSACLAVYHDKVTATVPAIFINNNATTSNGKYDIWGHSGNWWVDRDGNASFKSMTITGYPALRFFGGRTGGGVVSSVGATVAIGIGAVTVPANAFQNGLMVLFTAELYAFNEGTIAIEAWLDQSPWGGARMMAAGSPTLCRRDLAPPAFSGLPSLGFPCLFDSVGCGSGEPWIVGGYTNQTVWVRSGFPNLYGGGGSNWNPALPTQIDYTYLRTEGGTTVRIGRRAFTIMGF